MQMVKYLNTTIKYISMSKLQIVKSEFIMKAYQEEN